MLGEYVWLLSATDTIVSQDHVWRGEKVLHIVPLTQVARQDRVQRVVCKKGKRKKKTAIKKVSKIWVHSMSKGRIREWRQPPRMKTPVPSISWHTYGPYVTLPNLFHLFCCHLCYCDPQVAVSLFSDKAAGNLSVLRLAGYHCFSQASAGNHQVGARQVLSRINLNSVSRDSRI